MRQVVVLYLALPIMFGFCATQREILAGSSDSLLGNWAFELPDGAPARLQLCNV